MVQKSEPASAPGAAPLEEVKQSVHSDLQYVSIQVDERTYGGWYRLLPDGQMELLALANMHCERRAENTPIEQARGMLADFIRTRPQKAHERAADATDDDPSGRTEGDCAPATLGALLYADKAKTRIFEENWVGLLLSTAAGDRLALRELYERMHRVVFTLMVRLSHRESAEELTLEVFHDVWRRAHEYDAAGSGSVVGWIMNQARARAMHHLVFEPGNRRPLPSSEAPEVAPCPSEALWGRLARRIAAETGHGSAAAATPQWTEPEWEEVAPGISCKLLATDTEKRRVSMLVRLAPGMDYPPHTHAGVEELHLLDGALLIDDRLLHAGDYNRAEPGSADKRVWSKTGCTCVLVTSTEDVIT